MADSRPAPGPLTSTSTDRTPNVFAPCPAFIAACVAANGVPLREPLKPMPPALDQASTLPSASAIVMMVLLNDAWMCTTPWRTTRFSPRFLKVLPVFRRLRFAGADPVAPAASLLAINILFPGYFVFFFATAPLRGPFLVRAFVFVRWPRTGRLRRWRSPR